jgi:glutathione S-transferase
MAGEIGEGKLYGVSLSPFVRKVRAVLSIKSVDYELVNAMPGALDADLQAKSPLSKIPVWEEGDWSLPDSSVICAYLERKVPSPSIYPSQARAFATTLFWEEYADTRMVESGGPIFFQRVVQAKVFKQDPDEEIVRRHIEEVLPPVFDQLEAIFIERDRADPTELSVGNLSIWSPFVNLDHAGYKIDAATWPGLAKFLECFGEHAVLQGIVEEERAALATF